MEQVEQVGRRWGDVGEWLDPQMTTGKRDVCLDEELEYIARQDTVDKDDNCFSWERGRLD